MKKKTIFVMAVAIPIILGMLGVVRLFEPTKATSLELETRCRRVVEKAPEEEFDVEITFKNIGSTTGTWSIAVTFENTWVWKGREKQLTLEPDSRETLRWEGVVPADAELGSIARLVVYHGNDFTPLNWWIHVASDAELCIVHSKVS